MVKCTKLYCHHHYTGRSAIHRCTAAEITGHMSGWRSLGKSLIVHPGLLVSGKGWDPWLAFLAIVRQ